MALSEIKMKWNIIYRIKKVACLVAASFPGKGFTYAINTSNTSKQKESGISKEKIFLLNGILLSEY